MPELVLPSIPPPATEPSALIDSIDAALNSYAAPTLRSLKIDVRGIDIHANCIDPWLRFASERVVGKTSLRVNASLEEEELALPICERATEIEIGAYNFLLRPPPAGSFSALTDLKIACIEMDGGELGRVVSSAQCPRLRKLRLWVWKLEPDDDVSVRSESLECLSYYIAKRNRKLTSMCRLMLLKFALSPHKLESVEWFDPYDPGRHQFAEAGRHLRSLSIRHSTCYPILISSARLMERFDTASELTILLSLHEDIAGYMTFMKEMDKLPICETLNVCLMSNHRAHAFAPMMLHLLRRCSCIRKFKLFLAQRTSLKMTSCTASGCPCLLQESYMLDDITFVSLEEIEISFFTGSAEQEEFMELLLSRCNPLTLKRVDFTVPSVPVSSTVMEVVQRIRSMCHPNSKVQFNMHTR